MHAAGAQPRSAEARGSALAKQPVEPALTLRARGTAVHAEALGDGVDGVAERYSSAAAGDVGGKLVHAGHVGGVELFVGLCVSDEKAAFLAATGGVLNPRDAGILLPLCHALRIS